MPDGSPIPRISIVRINRETADSLSSSLVRISTRVNSIPLTLRRNVTFAARRGAPAVALICTRENHAVATTGEMVESLLPLEASRPRHQSLLHRVCAVRDKVSINANSERLISRDRAYTRDIDKGPRFARAGSTAGYTAAYNLIHSRAVM